MKARYFVPIAGLVVATLSARIGEAQSPVRAWEERMTIPTYRTDPPELNPMFYEGESYQGAKKKIYPYPFQDKITRELEDQVYTAVHLENDYVHITVLPELGGRLFAARDKTNGYDFFYRQHVIKPALIGMLGAWISGGIEWCVFHHHRDTTFMPVDYTLTENPNGSKTIWVGETERRHRMKWIVGLTLYPDRSYVEATVKFFNRTSRAHSILYWANVAVHANEDYQILFPPSVDVATYHSKNDFLHWPIGRGRYRGIDYSGVDMSWWKNHPEPISFFAWNLSEDFSGGYDHGRRAGVVHIGNHHVVSGTKLWEWSPGPRGRRWDGILTDDDGPYAELMVGAFSDNQPDYNWIEPHEVKTFHHRWYPVREIGGFKKANLDVAVNLELEGQTARVGLHPTRAIGGARVQLEASGDELFSRTVDVDPASPFTAEIPVPEGTTEYDLRVSLTSKTGRTLIAYRPEKRSEPSELPEPVRPPLPPEQIETNEELYLTGFRLQQMHNPAVPPEPYYEEALRRDPGNARVNTVVGANLIGRGLYQDAERYLSKALERLTEGYRRPRNGEAHYYLGVALRAQQRFEDAYDQFYRASWDRAFHAAAFHELSGLSLRAGAWARALDEIDRALAMNAQSTKSLGLKAVALRRLDRPEEARETARRALEIDPLDFLAWNELYLASGNDEISAGLQAKMRGNAQSYLELAADYGNVALWDEGIDVLERVSSTFPLVHYYLGYFYDQTDEDARAREAYRRAGELPPDYAFAFRLESIGVLEAALAADPNDHRAHYYLGNLFYEIQPERAIEHWERARSLNPDFSIVHRNLGWAYYRRRGDIDRAIESYEKAVSVNPDDTRLFAELDRLYEIANTPIAKRTKLLTSHHDVVSRRSDSLLRELIVLVAAGDYDRAIDLLGEHYFFVAEGGGRVHDVFVDAHLLRGLARLEDGRPREALVDFERAGEYPENLSVGRPRNDRRAPRVAYYIGLAQEALGDRGRASESFSRAARQEGTEGWPETRYFQALAYRKLGGEARAEVVFDELARRAEAELSQESIDFFAKFGQRQRGAARQSRAYYLLGLSERGRGDASEAMAHFERALELDTSRVWARYHLMHLRSRP